MYNDVFRGKRVFITGHTGFKGAWLTIYLRHLGAEVMGYALEPPTTPSLYTNTNLTYHIQEHMPADIRDMDRLRSAVLNFKPDFIFHLAAQPLVLELYRAPHETFEINVMGTIALMDAARELSDPCVFVAVSTDKCYENRGWHYGYRETDRLGGHDPYSASKAAMEIAIQSYRLSFFGEESPMRLATVRAGNVIGGGDWAANRIVPDIVRSLSAGEAISVRNPQAIRPWQHVLEPLSGYMQVAAKLSQDDWRPYAEAWNFGPLTHEVYTVGDLVKAAVQIWGEGEWVDASEGNAPHEAAVLKLSIEKATHQLGWLPAWDFQTAVQRTIAWYQTAQSASTDALYQLCLDDIKAYEQNAQNKHIAWTE